MAALNEVCITHDLFQQLTFCVLMKGGDKSSNDINEDKPKDTAGFDSSELAATKEVCITHDLFK